MAAAGRGMKKQEIGYYRDYVIVKLTALMISVIIKVRNETDNSKEESE